MKLFIVFGMLSLCPALSASNDFWGKIFDSCSNLLSLRFRQTPNVARDISKDSKVKQKMAEGGVYVSLTTSPKRIANLPQVLASLNLTNVAEVLLVIPERYSRDGQPYDIPKDLFSHPKLRILRIPEDFGPITKMLPALEFLKEHDPRGLLISIDDDSAYPDGMVNEFIYHWAHEPPAVLAASTETLDHWGTNLDLFPYQRMASSTRSGEVVEGWAGVAYPVDLVSTRELHRFRRLGEEAYRSDDMVISYSLLIQGVDVRTVDSEFYRRTNVKHMPWHFDSDASWRGGGFTSGYVGDYNRIKYTIAVERMVSDPSNWPAPILNSNQIKVAHPEREAWYRALKLLEQVSARQFAILDLSASTPSHLPSKILAGVAQHLNGTSVELRDLKDLTLGGTAWDFVYLRSPGNEEGTFSNELLPALENAKALMIELNGAVTPRMEAWLSKFILKGWAVKHYPHHIVLSKKL